MKALATFRPVSPKAQFGPIRPRNRFDDKGRTAFFGIDTKRQLKLELWANKLLGKAGFFQSEPDDREVLVDAIMIGVVGLRPMWHGRA